MYKSEEMSRPASYKGTGVEIENTKWQKHKETNRQTSTHSLTATTVLCGINEDAVLIICGLRKLEEFIHCCI